jgi:hypothetical protein
VTVKNVNQGGEFVLLDFPGFQEVYGQQRSDDANRFKELMSSFLRFGKIDVGIFVANGVPDMSQKQDFDTLSRCVSSRDPLLSHGVASVAAWACTLCVRLNNLTC